MIEPTQSAAVISAAGSSSRMGRPKALLDWGGKSLLQHQLDALAGWGQVVVVLGAWAEVIEGTLALPANARVVVHPGWAEGRASSLKAGFAALAGSPEAVLVTGVDQPLEPTVLDALASAMPTAGSAIAVPAVDGKRGHPALFSGGLLAEMRAIDEASEGLRAVLKRHEADVLEVAVASALPLLDLNTLEAYGAARRAELDSALASIPGRPVHTTRRSLALYTSKLSELFKRRPDLVVVAPDIYVSATPVEANRSVWINFGATDMATLAREMPQAWQRLRTLLAAEGDWKAEIWLSHASMEPLFADLGWKVASRMVRYRLEAFAESYPLAPEVREYRDSDFDQLLAIHRASSAPTEQLTAEGYRDLLTNVDRTAVFEAEGRLFGYTHVQIVGETGLFQGLAVHPDAQGRGVGKALVYEALSAMAERGAQCVELLALESAIPARRLYEKVGFAHVADQVWMDCLVPALAAEASVPAAEGLKAVES